MNAQDPDPRDLEDTMNEVEEAFKVEPLSPVGDDSGLNDDEERETSGNVPVANIE